MTTGVIVLKVMQKKRCVESRWRACSRPPWKSLMVLNIPSRASASSIPLHTFSYFSCLLAVQKNRSSTTSPTQSLVHHLLLVWPAVCAGRTSSPQSTWGETWPELTVEKKTESLLSARKLIRASRVHSAFFKQSHKRQKMHRHFERSSERNLGILQSSAFAPVHDSVRDSIIHCIQVVTPLWAT